MAVTGTITIQWNVPAQGAIPAESNSVVLSNAAAVGQVETVNLTTTPLELTIPAGTEFILIQGPTGNTINIVVGSTGTVTNCPAFSPTNMIEFPYPGSGNIYLSSASSTISGVQVIFI